MVLISFPITPEPCGTARAQEESPSFSLPLTAVAGIRIIAGMARRGP